MAPHPLDDGGRHRPHDMPASPDRLAHDLRGVRREVPPLDSPLKDALHDHEHATLSWQTDARRC
ncbi:MAG: hypothetical protein ACR2H2_06750 [Solirubrobacteraceae bacterium]